MTAEIEAVKMEFENVLEQSERAYHIAHAFLEDLKSHIAGYEFRDRQEEIRFFKETRPRFLQEKIYYAELFTTSSTLPVSRSRQKEHYAKALDRIAKFLYYHHEFYTYIRTGKTELDQQLFIVNESDNTLMFPDASVCDVDMRICTPASYKVAQLQAYERLASYLENALLRLESPPSNVSGERKAPPPLIWTATLNQLYELVYALQSFGAFNKGQASVKQIMQYLEYCFSVRASNYYGAFQAMRIRKKNRTIFIDALRDSLIKRMDESDEFSRMS